MNIERFWYEYMKRTNGMEPFPREMMRKRLRVDNLTEFASVISGYNGKTDLYTSLYNDWQMKNNVFDCAFFEIDCYTEVGEDVHTLNKMAEVVETFLFDEGVWYRRFFSGKKGLHYYIAFPPCHFHYFGNAVRTWARRMPKVERVDMNKYIYTGEITMIKTWPYDPRTIGNTKQLVRIPYTKHPRTGLKCIETYGRVSIPMLERHESWLPEENLHFQQKLKRLDKEPEIVDRSGGMIDFEFSESPKCIRKSLMAMRGHLTHDQAWHLANFMVTLGAEDKEIVDVFRIDPRFNESMAYAQVASIRQSGLANMGCDKIAYHGLCDEKQKLSCPMWPSIDRYLFDGETEDEK